MKIRKSRSLSLGVAGLLASAMMTGCAPSGEVIDADYAQVCQDKKTETRVEDNHCSEEGRSGGYYGWYFYQSGANSIPAVGTKLTGGSATVPAAGKSVKSAPSKGGTVSRGGFGTSAKGSSGG
jgi:uncharacterized protein YgiB involved in biofilm formation